MATNNLMNKITLYYSQMTKAEKKVADLYSVSVAL